MPESSAESKLTTKSKLAYGSGNAADRIQQGTVGQMANPIFNDLLGVDPRIVGFVLGFSRVFEALVSPLIGQLSDETRSRWGRRKPWIFVATIVGAFAYAMMWSFPEGASESFYAWWFLAVSVVLFAAGAAFAVPYDAMGMEMTMEYQERTSVMAYRAAMTKIGALFVASLFWFINLPAFENGLAGMRAVGWGCAVVILILGLVPVFLVKESGVQDPLSRRATVGIASTLKNIRHTFRYRPFVLLVVANTILCFGFSLVVHLGYYAIVYHVFGGEKGAEVGMVLSFAGYAAVLGSLLGIPTMVKLSRKWGKHGMLLFALGLAALGNLLKWPCYVPSNPWLVMIPDFILAFAFTSIWNLIRSMVPDVVDMQDLQEGVRKEGMFSAVFGLMFKLGTALSLFLSGYTLELSGFDGAIQGAQSENTILGIRLFYVVVPAIALLVAIMLIKLYPLTEKVVRENQKRLQKR